MKDLVLAPQSKIDTNTYRKQLQSLEALRAGKPEPDFKKKRVPPPDEGKGLYDPMLAPKSKIEMKNYRKQLKALEALRAGEPEPKEKWVPPPDDGKGVPPWCVRKTLLEREADKNSWNHSWEAKEKAERLEHKEAQAQKNLQAINNARNEAGWKRSGHASSARTRAFPETYLRKSFPVNAKVLDMCKPEQLHGGPKITTRAQRSEIPIPLMADVPARRPSLRGKSKADKTAHKSPPQLEAEPERLKGKALYDKVTTPSAQTPTRSMSFNAYGESQINRTGILVPTYKDPKAKDKEAAVIELLQAAKREKWAMLRKLESFKEQDKIYEAGRKRENIDD